MPKYAVQPQWRSRRAAICKKGSLDSELLQESELIVMERGKRVEASSPITVATVNFMVDVPEMKPLPGAWVTVGKGGKLVKDSLMYDEPMQMKGKSKRKKRVRARKEDESPLERLAYEGTSTQGKGGRVAKLEKEVRKAKEAKHWARYQRDKQLKVLARDTLIAALAAGGMLTVESEVEVKAPEPLARNNKGRSRGAKERHEARLASAAARCYPVDVDDEEIGGLDSQLGQAHRAKAWRASAPRGSVQTRGVQTRGVQPRSSERDESGFSALDEAEASPAPPAPPASSLTSAPSPNGKQDKGKHDEGKRQSKQCSVM